MSVVTRIRTSEELTVPFTPEEVWDVLAAASAYPNWWPVQWPARVLSDQPGLLGSEIEVRPLVGGMFRFRFEELHEPFAMRLRFFGGRLEGPGGFLLQPGDDGGTRIRYDIDVFARGMGTAAVSQVFPLEAVQRFHMRSVLRNLEKEVRAKRDVAAARLRAEAARVASETAARLAAEEESRRLAAEAEAETARVAAETAARLAAEEAARRMAIEEAAMRAAQEAESRRVAEESRVAEEARVAAEIAARLAAEEESRRLAAELEARRIAEAEARRLAAEEVERHRVVEQARLAAEAETARVAAETAARLAAEEAARRLAIEEAAMRAAQEAESRRVAEESRVAEEARVAAETAARFAAEEEARRLAAELEAHRIAEAEAMRLAAEEVERQRVAEHVRLAAEAEAETARVAAEAAARLAAEETARRREEEARALIPPESPTDSWLRRVQGWFLRPEAPAPEALVAPGGESNFTIARNYVSALSSRPSPKTLDAFLAKDLVRVEYPHRFLDRATTSRVEGTFGPRAREAGTFETEAFELKGATGGGSQVAMEIAWNGRVGQDAPPLVQGQELDARLAVFLKFHDGRIVREHVYACFEPWSSPSERARAQAERSKAERFIPKAGDSGHGSSQSNFEIARSYLAAMNAGAGPEEVAGFFAEEGVQEEFPNLFAPVGAVRTRDEIGKARARDLALLKSEYHELRGAFGGGSQVAMEIAWTAVIGAATGSYSAGQKLEGQIAVFLKFRDGLIVRQRSYRCIPAIVSVTAADVHSL